MYAAKQPTMYNAADNQSTTRLTPLAVWHVVGSFGLQAPLLI